MKCPHCSEAIDNAVDKAEAQTKLESRLATKNGEITQLKSALTLAQTEAGDVGAIRTERDRLQGELTGIREAAVISAAYEAAGIADEQGVREGFRVMHASAMASVPEADQVSLAEWVQGEAAKAHPLLAGHYGAPEGKPGTPGDKGPADPVSPGLPNGDSGATPPPAGSTGLQTPDQVAAYFSSPEYRSMSPEDQKQRFAELKGEAGLGGVFNPAPKLTVAAKP